MGTKPHERCFLLSFIHNYQIIILMRKKILMTLAFAFAMSVGAYAQAAETVLEEGGTGPYKAVVYEVEGFAEHTIFAPKDLSVFNEKKPADSHARSSRWSRWTGRSSRMLTRRVLSTRRSTPRTSVSRVCRAAVCRHSLTASTSALPQS